MIGIDTCFLIDLYWQDSPRNKNARALYSRIANDESIKVAVYYNCFNEFLHVTVLYPDDTSFKRTLSWMNRYQLGRNRVNDTQMASCYLTSGVASIITANPKDFEIFESFEINDYS